jgi:hypothetical protein
MNAATHFNRKQQHAKIRLAAARAAVEAKRAQDPIEPAIVEAERYQRRLNGRD